MSLQPIDGEWIGNVVGPMPGNLILDIERQSGNYHAMLRYFAPNNAFPAFNASAHVSSKGPKIIFGATLQSYIDLASGNFVVWGVPGGPVGPPPAPEAAVLQLELTDADSLAGTFSTGGAEGYATFKRSRIGNRSKVDSKTMSWREYKGHVSQLNLDRHIFRGQRQAWPLQTLFHRLGRMDLIKYSLRDIPELHRYLTGVTGRRYNLADPIDHAAFMYLALHYRYPTPFLDWTESPYVATYFAFEDIEPLEVEGAVRIFIMDISSWSDTQYRSLQLTNPIPNITPLKPLAMGNDRMAPQQSFCFSTNVCDIESFILDKQRETQYRYVEAVDIPYSERREVMRELRAMGITAAAMFPGVEGVTKALRHRYFLEDG